MMNELLDETKAVFAHIQAANRAHELEEMAREGTPMETVIHRYEDLTLGELGELARHSLDPTGHQSDLPDRAVRTVMKNYIDEISDLRPDIGQRLGQELVASDEGQG